MPDLSLDLRNLRYVLAVLEQGSFRQAASSLGVPQSTISRRVAQLEDRLGISIFDRDHRGVRLTSAGERFIDEALVGAQHFANALGASQAVRRGQEGRLHLGLFTSLRNEFLRELVGDYHRRHQAIECFFEEGNTRDLISGVLDSRLDIAFVTGRPVSLRCDVTSLGEEQLYIAQPDIESRGSDPDQPAEIASLRDRRFIVTRGGRGPDVEDFLVAQLSAPGFRPDVRVHDVSFESLLHMVELGFGTAIVSEGAVSKGGPIFFRALKGPQSSVRSSAIWLKTNTNPALQPFLALARQKLARGPQGLLAGSDRKQGLR